MDQSAYDIKRTKIPQSRILTLGFLIAPTFVSAQKTQVPSAPASYLLEYSVKQISPSISYDTRTTLMIGERDGTLFQKVTTASAPDFILVYDGVRTLRTLGKGQYSLTNGYTSMALPIRLQLPFNFNQKRVFITTEELTKRVPMNGTKASDFSAYQLGVVLADSTTPDLIAPVQVTPPNKEVSQPQTLVVGISQAPLFRYDYSDYKKIGQMVVPFTVMVTKYKQVWPEKQGESLRSVPSTRHLLSLKQDVVQEKVPSIQKVLRVGDLIQYESAKGNVAFMFDPASSFEAQAKAATLLRNESEIAQSDKGTDPSKPRMLIPIVLTGMFGALAVIFLVLSRRR